MNLDQARHFLKEKPIRVNVIDRPRLTCELVCMEPGQREDRQSFDVSDNLYVVVEGTCTIRTSASEHELGLHNALVVPPGVEHWLQNAGTERVTVMAFVAPKPARASEVRFPRQQRDFTRPRPAFRPRPVQQGDSEDEELPEVPDDVDIQALIAELEAEDGEDEEQGEKPSRQQERSFPERGSFDRDRRDFGNRGGGGARREFSGGHENRGPRRDFSPRPFNDRAGPPRRNFGDRPAYGGGGGQRRNSGDRPAYGGPRRDFNDRPREGGPRDESGERIRGAARRDFRPSGGDDRPRSNRPDFPNQYGRPRGGDGEGRPPYEQQRGPRPFGNRPPPRRNFDTGGTNEERGNRRPPVSRDFYPKKPNQTGGSKEFAPRPGSRSGAPSNRGGFSGAGRGGRPGAPPPRGGRPGGKSGGPRSSSRPSPGRNGRQGPGRNGPRTSGRRPGP
jgi:quercetin dioxygenase-like cupin family protein